MKQILKLTIVGLIAFAMAYSIGSYIRKHRRPPEPEIVKPPWTADLPEALVVYCFHPDKQTPRCKKIEEQTHKLLKESFAKELKSGRIVWRVVNYEKPEGKAAKHIVEELKPSATCIVLVDGREGRWGNSRSFPTKTWDLVDSDANKFKEFMDEQIRASLN